MGSDWMVKRSLSALFFLCFAAMGLVRAQSNEQARLEAERQALADRISATQTLLSNTQKDRAKSTQEWAVLKEQLSLRQQLLSNLRLERRAAERRLAKREGGVQTADDQLKSLKSEYAEMIRIAARLGGQDQWWQAILDAEGTTQAFRRLMFIEEYRRTREDQASKIVQSASALRAELNALDAERKELLQLESVLGSERDAARQSAKKMEALVDDFQSRERELRDQLATEEARRAELGKAIARLMEAAREVDSGSVSFAATPEGQVIGAEFKANKGRLPWPVSKGVLVGRFGTHPHPSLPGIRIERRGIDIATKAEGEVTSIFSGRVSNVIPIPGGGIVVMVNHGSHRSVYANLGSVAVKTGDDLRTGQLIGTVIDLGEGPRAHLEIWNAAGSSPLDPEPWIAQ